MILICFNSCFVLRVSDTTILVPSDLTNELVEDRLGDPDAANGFLLDGYPRSLGQAKALHDMLERRGTKIDVALEFRVSQEVLRERLRDELGVTPSVDTVALHRSLVA